MNIKAKETLQDKINKLEEEIQNDEKALLDIQVEIGPIIENLNQQIGKLSSKDIEDNTKLLSKLNEKLRLTEKTIEEKRERLEVFQRKQAEQQKCKEKSKAVKKIGTNKTNETIELGIVFEFHGEPVVSYLAESRKFILNSQRAKTGEFTKSTYEKMNQHLDQLAPPLQVIYTGRENKQFFVRYNGENHPFDEEIFEIDMKKLFPKWKPDIPVM